MTYGENTARIRAELTILLRQHRIQRRHDGLGPLTLSERRQLGGQIRRYRQTVLVWCRQAAITVDPRLGLAANSHRTRGPSENLQIRLGEVIDTSDAPLPSLKELSSEQAVPLLDTWRRAARAAALGEHDLGSDITRSPLSENQRLAVLRDIAEIAQALAVLDQRYKSLPGWKQLPAGRYGLARAARATALFAARADQDYSVDQQGWRSPSALIEGPALPGIGGVVQAEHNMIVHLSRFPDALNLKRVIGSQLNLSHNLATRTAGIAPELAQAWADREQTYMRLQRSFRDVGGRIGRGTQAAAEAANAVSRLRDLSADDLTAAAPLHDMNKLFRHADSRIATLIEQGANQRLYFQRVTVPRIVSNSGHMTSPVRERYAPISAAIGGELLAIVHDELRPAPTTPSTPSGAANSRDTFRAAIHHKPTRRATGPAI